MLKIIKRHNLVMVIYNNIPNLLHMLCLHSQKIQN